MEENNVVATENNGTVENNNGEKLTAGEKWLLLGICGVIGAGGWAVGTFIIDPAIRGLSSVIKSRKEANAGYKKAGKKKAKKSNNGTEYDEEGDYREIDDDEETED